MAGVNEMEWQPISSAPKDCDILVWFDHGADAYVEDEETGRLTDYGALAEGEYFLSGEGVAIAKWHDKIWESEDEYGNGYWLPAGWFSRGDFGDYEVVCNPTHWMPLPNPPTIQPDK